MTKHPLERSYKRLVENGRDLICRHHLDGRYSYVSASITRIAGWSVEDLLEKNPYDFFHPEDHEYIKKNSHKVVVDDFDQETLIEYRFRCKDGQYIWLQTFSQIIQFEGEDPEIYTISRDVTALIQIQTELSRQKKIIEDSGHLAKLGSWHIDMKDQKPIWSEMVRKIHEVPADFVPELDKAVEFYYEDDRPAILKAIEASQAEGKEWDLKLRIVTYKKNLKWVRAVGRVEKKDGKVTAMYGVFQDIHEDVVYAQTLERQRDRLSEISQILAHDLRGPSGNIKSLIPFLQKEELADERESIVQMLSDSADKLLNILETVVDMLKLELDEALPSEEIHINEFINQIWESLLPDKTMKLKLDLEKSLLVYNRLVLNSIIYNLLSNAIRYRKADRDLQVNIVYTIENNKEKLIIEDNGSGMDLEQNKNKLFKIGRSFHREPGSKGLGLFMVKNQIESQGGIIEVESEVDKGSRFTVWLKGKPGL